ncbi:MAG: FadR family transcriptional regulator [Spirochaetes bacterium]|nr:FadR family transcriptional regulator [Spirochaetota bacterium]
MKKNSSDRGKKRPQKKIRQRHEIVAAGLMSKIFSGVLKPGAKLPTEKQLALEMKIDRTSLRVALKQLEAMQLLEIIQGDGIYVNDYMQNAGLDFLRMLIMHGKGDERGVTLFDEYLLDEVWEFWEMFLPQTVILASKKFSPRDLKNMMNLLEEELEHINNDEKIVAYEIENQDMMARIANNMILMLLYNSSRPVREKMLRIIVRFLSRQEKKEHVLAKITLLQKYSTGTIEDAVIGAEEYRQLLSRFRKKIRQGMKAKSSQKKKARG